MDHELHLTGGKSTAMSDVANEMKIATWRTRNTLEEYKGAASVMASDDDLSLDGIYQKYLEAITDFDTSAGLYIEGGVVDDVKILKAEDPDIIQKLNQTEEFNITKLMPAAETIIKSGRKWIENQKRMDWAMLNLKQKPADTIQFSFRNLSLAVPISIIISIFLTKGITRHISIAFDASTGIASGDFTGSIDVDHKDEAGILLQDVFDQFKLVTA